MCKGRTGGFTLVEVIVAAMILSLAIIVIVAVVRKGREMDTNDLHRRQARAIVTSILESSQYDYTNYTAFAAAPGTTTSTVPIDPRNGTNPLTGTLSITIDAPSTVSNVPMIRITVTVSWQEVGFQDAVTIEKWITEAL